MSGMADGGGCLFSAALALFRFLRLSDNSIRRMEQFISLAHVTVAAQDLVSHQLSHARYLTALCKPHTRHQ